MRKLTRKNFPLLLACGLVLCWGLEGFWLDTDTVVATMHEVGAVLLAAVCGCWLLLLEQYD